MEGEKQKGEKSDRKITSTKYGETTVARHFYQNNHKVSGLKWMVLEQIEGNNTRQMQNKLLKTGGILDYYGRYFGLLL